MTMSQQTSETTVPARDKLLHMYRVMKLATELNEQANRAKRNGSLQAALYPIRGLEAVCGALAITMQPGDQLFSTYRNMGDLVAKGVAPRAIIAELLGRTTGTSRGKGGSMHIQDESLGMMGTTGIVGSGLPIAIGLGMAAQFDGDERAVVTTFGDGATSIGAAHESFNMAALWDLPVVFVCQNNGWGEHTPIHEYAANTDLAARARSYGMRAVTVDGFDPIATHDALDAALVHARHGGGPTFVEAKTYRLSGHTATADMSYMPADDLEAAKGRDPAPAFSEWLVNEGHATTQDLETIDGEVGQAVDDAFEFAESSPPTDVGELYTDVFEDAEWVTGR